MNEHHATEISFKNGYEKGVRDTKSEVERLEAELAKAKEKAERMQRNLEGVLEERSEYPTEVVREIFAEIDRAVENAELEWGTICGVKLCIAELKKKYTEGNV